MKKITFLTLILLGLNLSAKAQLRVLAGTQIPVQYNVGLDYQFAKRWAVNAHIGVLTKPYDQIILNIIEGFGTDEVYIRMIENAFQFGVVTDIGLRFHLNKKNYLGIYGQYIALSAQDTPQEVIESFFGVNLTTFPRIGGLRNINNNIDLLLKSNLLQLGLTYGRVIPLTSRLDLRLEFDISANIGSSSTLSSNTRNLTNLSTTVDNELSTFYRNYAFVPGITIHFAYLLSKPRND